MWRAPAAGVTKEVILLEAMYFAPEVPNLLDFHVKECGCETSGVGCMICGNPLGSLITPCARHEGSTPAALRYTFLPTAVSPLLPLPPSPERREALIYNTARITAELGRGVLYESVEPQPPRQRRSTCMSTGGRAPRSI
ncbi:hypothetical protein DFH07DRAFT_968547 [Mycena maculata]|uniref:Uncharacterized protein n=1 Tax=Mycena maculata TaxID=230809 RepID=A0AAD7MT52_9AGAR|nr:hypothetical protein DFH07DRAFT_968547 [Mycena maculata]